MVKQWKFEKELLLRGTLLKVGPQPAARLGVGRWRVRLRCTSIINFGVVSIWRQQTFERGISSNFWGEFGICTKSWNDESRDGRNSNDSAGEYSADSPYGTSKQAWNDGRTLEIREGETSRTAALGAMWAPLPPSSLSSSTPVVPGNPGDRRNRYMSSSREEVSDGDLWDFLHGYIPEDPPVEIPDDEEIYNDDIESEEESSDGSFARVSESAVSPLPQDLGDLMSNLRLRRVQEGCPLFLSRRSHAPLQKMFRPYDANSQLLQRHDPPRNAPRNFEVKTETHVNNGQLHSDGGADGASNHERHWNGNSWNQWTNGNGNQINQINQQVWNNVSTWSAWNPSNASNAMEDDDDETWGKWKPDGRKEPVPEPKEPPPWTTQPKEPDVKRPRTESQPQVPLTPPGIDQAQPSGWKRMESTRQAGVFYYLNTTTMQTQVEPPPPWEKKQSRRDPTILYYWNPVTNQTSLEKPLI
eukprot:s2061_g20.t1